MNAILIVTDDIGNIDSQVLENITETLIIEHKENNCCRVRARIGNIVTGSISMDEIVVKNEVEGESFLLGDARVNVTNGYMVFDTAYTDLGTLTAICQKIRNRIRLKLEMSAKTWAAKQCLDCTIESYSAMLKLVSESLKKREPIQNTMNAVKQYACRNGQSCFLVDSVDWREIIKSYIEEIKES